MNIEKEKGDFNQKTQLMKHTTKTADEYCVYIVYQFIHMSVTYRADRLQKNKVGAPIT